MDKPSFEKLVQNGAFGNSVHFVNSVKEIESWEMPVPFNEIRTPAFPLESLPGPLLSFVECLAESTQTPEEMAGILSLGVLATAFQSKLDVQITPDWKEPLCLYCVAVAAPGERKTAVISALTKPLYEYEFEQKELEAVEIEQNRTERTLLERALQNAQTSATKRKGNFEQAKQEALDISAQLATFKDKHEFRLLVDDTTVEKLVDIMDTQGGCVTVCSAEGGVFDAMSGRYDNKANFDVYLKGHAGDPIVVDRIGRKQNRIMNPRLTMLLTIQPEVLGGLMGNTTFKGRGLCGRFLFAMCHSKVGNRKIAPDPMPEEVRQEYRSFVRRILSSEYRGTIRLSPDADEIRKAYQEYIEKKLGNEWENMRDWGGKLTGAMVRVAALMHAAQVQGDPTEIPIPPETMIAATSIAEFLASNAEAVYQLMGADTECEDARYLWKKIEGSGRDKISKRDLFRIVQGKFKKAENIETPLKVLEEYGYIRITEAERNGAGRKASPQIKINPIALTQLTKLTEY